MNRDELEASLANAADQFEHFRRELDLQRKEIRDLLRRVAELEKRK